MRKCLENNRWAAVAVAMLLLFATSGMALSRMTCLMSGHSVLSLGTAVDCCPEDEQSTVPTVSGLCCDLSLAQGNDDPYLGNPGVAFAPLLAVLDHAPFHVVGVVRVAVPAHTERRPPPRPVPERLAVLSTFLI